MKCISSVCVFTVFIFSVLHQGVTAWKPKMTPAVDELLIQEGDELRIECQGEGRLQFSTQKLTGNVEPSNFRTSVDEATGTYTFICPNATIRNTGWYACAEVGVDIRNDEQTIEHPSENISWIYVYVNSSEPFAVKDAFFEAVIMKAGSDGVIPCRPTSPELPVILETQGGDIPVPEGTKYDPRIGFILKEIGKERTGESYTCKLNGTDAENEYIVWPLYYAVVEDNTPLKAPKINKDRLHHVVWGENVTLDCRITVIPGIRFSLNWIVPSSIPRERLVYGSDQATFVESSGSGETWKRELTILNVQKTDGGEYICVAQGMDANNQAQTSAKIEISDPSHTYITVSVDGPKDIVSPEGQTAQWKIMIDTHPEQFQWKWYKEDGTLIETTEVDAKSRFSHTRNGYYHLFKISPLNIQDSGQYTLHVFTSTEVKSITLPLTVVGPPIVHMYNTLPIYAPGETAIIFSSVTGSPSPNVTWSYREYPDFPSKENSKLTSLSNIHNEKVYGTRFSLVSRLNVTINTTGDLISSSCNFVNCTENIQQIFVSDVGAFFAILNPGEVTEGDDIDVTCGASVYNFTDNLRWEFDDSKEQGLNSSRIHITERKTKFTWQSTLHIRNVTKFDAGKYSCEAVNKEGHRERETYQLQVGDARAPEILYTNMWNSEIRMDLKRDNSKGVILECRVDGRPFPKVTWHKNNVPLKESAQYKFSENNTKLQIVYFYDADVDSGRYACTARNRIGEAETYMDIIIAGKSDNTTLWISLSCVIIAIIVTAIVYKGIKAHRKRVLYRSIHRNHEFTPVVKSVE